MSQQTSKKLFNVTFDHKTDKLTKTKKHVARNKRLLRTVEEFIQEINRNDEEALLKSSPTFLPKHHLEELAFKPPELEKYKEHQKKFLAKSKNQEYETVKIWKPVFQNPTIEKYLNESMKETLNKYKYHKFN